MGFSPRTLEAPRVTAVARMEWEEPYCLLCGSRRWSPLIEAPDNMPGGTGMWFAIVQCQNCGLCFTNPRPSQRAIEQFYPSAYWSHRSPSPLARKPASPRPGRRWFRLRRECRVIRWQGEGRLLDFGCGGGSFLARMRGRGWRVLGLDMSPAAVQRVKTELNLPALVGSLPHPDLPSESFDVVTMWHSLEHVHYPCEVLRQAYNLLVPGGRLFVAVPNIDSLQFHWFLHSWYGLDLPRHLTHFAPSTLQCMLEKAGFRVGPIRMVSRSGWMRSSARLAGETGRGPKWRNWLQGKQASRLATFYSNLTFQGDCITVVAKRPE